MKKIFFIFLLFLLFLAWPASAYYSLGQPGGFVNDYAALLSVEEKNLLEAKLFDFEKTSSNEIAVVTIPNLEGDTIENFAIELFSEWGIGKEKNDNGVLVLVARDDRKMRIEVGYGLEGALTDAQSYWIINDVMKPAFQAEDYYQGISGAVDKIIAATQGEYLPESSSGEAQGFEQFFFFIYFAIFIIIWLASILGRSKSWWAGGVVGGFGGMIISIFQGFLYAGLVSLAILIPLGLLFDFLVSRSYKAHKTSGSTPWWAGGGGGSSGGGGFGGFGGGSSGGGGASGGW